MSADDWFAVSYFLYSGILQKLSFYKESPVYATPKKLKELEDAIEVYSKNCIVNEKSLAEDYQALCGSIRVHEENILKIARTTEDYRKQERFDPQQLKQIRLGLYNEIDVSKYADPSYNADQMQEIRWGLDEGIDVSKYADPSNNVEQMRKIRWRLEDGVDVDSYANPELTPREMEIKRLNMIWGNKASEEVEEVVEDEYDMEI